MTASTTAIHRNPSVFPAPEVFDPARWLDSSPEESDRSENCQITQPLRASQRIRELEKAFMPFGYGARACLGKSFATMEIKLLLAELYTRYSTRVNWESKTTEEGMEQAATHDAIPRGGRCDIIFVRLDNVV